MYTIFFIPTAYGQNIASPSLFPPIEKFPADQAHATQATVIIARFIGGVAASTGSTLVGGTVADLFETHNRGLPMSIFSICAFMGTGLGPAVSGYIELKKGWRWIEWVQASPPAGLIPLSLRRGRHSCSTIADDVRGRHGGSHHSLHA